MSQPDVYAAELGRQVVAEVAPAELPLFDVTWQAVGRRPRRSRRREEPLGFGLPEAGDVLVTAAASGVVTTILEDLGKDFGSWLARLWARLCRRPPETVLPDPLPPLSPERLSQIRRLARAKARKLGLAGPQADALADSLVSALATSRDRV